MGHRIQLVAGADEATAIEALCKRVDGTQLILHADTHVPSGEWVAFEIRLEDQTLVWEGMGKCQLSARDGATFEVLLTDLQLDDEGEAVLARVHAVQKGDAPVAPPPLPAAAPPPPPPPAPAARISSPPEPPPRQSSPPARPSQPPTPQVPQVPKAAKASSASSSSPSGLPPKALSVPKPPTGDRPEPVTAYAAGRPSSPPVSAQRTAAGMPADAVDDRLSRLLPKLRELGRASDAAGARALALDVGLAALEAALLSES